ncbi:GNAT family N-acetyltransferase [Aestuariivirga litoralis]|uniref:GNAT family N-acetyltransferase n=1 Tax=Aestuariivirga litoralis TaxID=2650924 RepID=UPI0018C58187|nr:GNAT family N-acetyltransferase [Aestuariivirga litoralis]MBG1233019.1 GNAT family N-acetyltransferase [Aestuariivirga litoralis]
MGVEFWSLHEQEQLWPKGKLPKGCRLIHVTTLQSLARLAPAWRTLEQTSAVRPTVFQSFDWVSHWCEVFACPESRVELSVVVGYRGDEVVFIAPWQKAHRPGISRLVWLTYPMAQYGDVLCQAGEDASMWLDSAVAMMKRQGNYDLLHLRHVRKSSVFYPYAMSRFFDGKLYEKAPWMDYSIYPDAESYEGRLTRQQRKHRKHVRGKLEKIGEVKFETLEPGPRWDEVLDLALSEKRDWLESNGLVSAVISEKRHDELLKTLGHRDQGDVKIDLTQLSVNGNSVCWEIGLRYGKTHYCYIIARRNAVKDQSPGRLHFELNQRRTFQEGLTSFDLLSPNDAYKESWANSAEPVNDYYYPLTARGSVYGRLYISLLRPTLRRLYNYAPVSLKRAVAR